MKVKEALEVLRQMDPNKEVHLHFTDDGHTKDISHGTWYPGDSRIDGTDHPCGGRYETQAERFGSR